MRSAFALAALAAGAIAVPFAAEHKRGLEYDVEVEYVTKIVTVTAFGSAPSEPAKVSHYGHKPQVTTPPAPKATAPTYEAPAAAPVYEAPAPVADSSSGGAPTDYQSAVLHAHNLHRANHSAPALEWDKDLASSAQQLANTCRYEHDTSFNGGGYGQNIAAGVPENEIGRVISDMFYNGEEPLYAAFYGQEPDMGNFAAWGHFSQIVWKSTTHVACATTSCRVLANTGGGVPAHFTVCNYKGPGNFAGQYAQNVLAPLGQATVDASASAY